MVSHDAVYIVLVRWIYTLVDQRLVPISGCCSLCQDRNILQCTNPAFHYPINKHSPCKIQPSWQMRSDTFPDCWGLHLHLSSCKSPWICPLSLSVQASFGPLYSCFFHPTKDVFPQFISSLVSYSPLPEPWSSVAAASSSSLSLDIQLLFQPCFWQLPFQLSSLPFLDFHSTF